MAKQSRRTRQRPIPSARRETPSSRAVKQPRTRLHSLDALRGLAIVLMIVDHVSGILLSINIEFAGVRFWTRLSMPLFAVLMGYLFDTQRPFNLQRLGQIAIACLIVNATYATRYSELEILSSLLCACLLFFALRSKFAYAYLLVFLAPWDVSARLFDYPLAIVIPCVALGFILQKSGWRWAAINSLLALPLIVWIEQPTQYVLYFMLPAVMLVAGAVTLKNLRVPPLEFLGRYPLTSYVIQYYVIFSIAQLLGF